MYKQLTREQRYTIYVLLQNGKSKKEIASTIGVNKSTVYREIKRNRSEKRGLYHWSRAEEYARINKERLKRRRTVTSALYKKVVSLLQEEQWSPKQISGSLLLNEGIHISHETIYAIIREDMARGGTLYKNCRHKLRYRRHDRSYWKSKTKVKGIPNRVSIHDRPAEADGRRFGDWEMDTIIGKGAKDAILTLCERSTNMLMMCRLKDGRKSECVVEAVKRLLLPYRRYVRTITTDNGSEFTKHELISKALHVKIYFTDSYSSWQKGAIENTNKLIRQYIPKGSDFDTFSDAYIKEVQYKINRRPREKLKFSTPMKEFYKHF